MVIRECGGPAPTRSAGVIGLWLSRYPGACYRPDRALTVCLLPTEGQTTQSWRRKDELKRFSSTLTPFLICHPPPPPTCLQDFEKISEYFKAHYKVELTEKDMCVKGWNWGTAKFSGKPHLYLPTPAHTYSHIHTHINATKKLFFIL